ncbi:TetR/AcrR family transcriptional regulator [Anaerobacillus isosaccharinicus]|uniref:TetR/AcrR family transcriptional regulator n=1 Tax=Anaerobacillus isosaccharinicus TaxID=1532552 RepID=A0A1S2KW16_9BACI|nr:TetR/AcrR family transcriptional regulator [Anaerobacillus isosaccharinicus]MBA5584800.1 TetR/AcrR family transcriptional regulator [Anaerobacillus isosaccharinicus]QOY36835.1 TetR/AcrR family transcriptional regulator [Anaerobacillus isosaccharinicus]
MPQETREKILQAAIALMSLKGYSATTTKEISQLAGVSEMTLFRKYKTKQEILDNLIEKYTSSFQAKKIFVENDLVYDLEVDLANVSRTYQTFMNENKKVVLLAYKESGTHDEISERLTANPRLMKKFLMDYLLEMKRRDKIIPDINIELTVLSFMTMNLGFFSSQFISVKKVAVVSVEAFIEHSVKIFARGLKK